MHYTTISAGVGIVETPITAHDNFKVWVYSGDLHAVIEGSLETANIEWVQISGSAVVFTSPTNVADITFTTTDLENKEFICYTNRNTLVEQSDRATFYHHPIDTLTLKSRGDVHNTVLTTLPSVDQTELLVTAGMMCSDTGLERCNLVPSYVYGIGESTDDMTLNVEVRITNYPTHLHSSTTTLVEIENTPGVWTTLQVSTKYINTVIGADKPIRITHYAYWYGMMYVLEYTRDDILNILDHAVGASDVISAKYTSGTYASAFETNTHTIGVTTVSDTLSINNSGGTIVTNYDSNIHTIIDMQMVDTLTTVSTHTLHVSNLVSTVHTSTNVG